MNVSIALLRYLHLRKFLTWESWGGFGITLNWPNEGWEKDTEVIKQIFDHHLPKDYVVSGPCFAAGGAMVVYVWPKDDPNLRELLTKQNEAKPILEAKSTLDENDK